MNTEYAPRWAGLAVGAAFALSWNLAMAADSPEKPIPFETQTHPLFSVRSKFTGTATVGTTAMVVRVDRGVIGYTEHGPAGDSRRIEGYDVSLVTDGGSDWNTVSEGAFIRLGSNLIYGSQITVGVAQITIALTNITVPTNHWLAFRVWHVSPKRTSPGFAPSLSAKTLFTNLPITGDNETFRRHSLYAARDRFLFTNWSRFPVFNFVAPGPDGATILQAFRASENVVGWFDGRGYCGLRLTIPTWRDGDLVYAFLHTYQSQRELKRRPSYEWGIVGQGGESVRVPSLERILFRDRPESQNQYPFTEKAYQNTIPRYLLGPGRTYLLWWSHSWEKAGMEGPPTDMVVGFTISSPRGKKEFGELIWR